MHVYHLSVCSGIAGIDLGLRQCVEGVRTIAMVEREAFVTGHLVAQMEAGRLDPCPIYTDVHRFPWEDFARVVDIVSGGVPCQPFSHAGSRKGIEDERHLWPALREGIRIVRPRVVFLENVDGIATAPSPGYHSVLHHVLSDLEAMGFRATADCFTASEISAPHQRKRWFVLAVADRNGGGQQELSEALDHDGGDARRHHARRRSTAVAYRDRSGLERFTGDVFRSTGSAGRGGLDQDREGIEREDRPAPEGSVRRWPAGPGQQQHEWEEPRTLEPRLGRAVDGLSGRVDEGAARRVDRLRALGNAVVPSVAALAFASLHEELTSDTET